MATTDAQTGYAPVGDLNMYYEIHGRGGPTILLHGAYMTIDLMGPILSGLAESRQVIAMEQQGHGHTADVDRPLTYEQMADDTAALACHLEIDTADVVGYSMGGGIALQMFPSITSELFAGSPIEQAYLRTAPNPADFPKLVEKMKQLDTTPFAWSEEDIRAIAAPTLIVLGDSDGIRLEHAVELFRLRGGGVMGDLAGLPKSQLAVLPGTAHYVPPGSGLRDRTEWLLTLLPPFLDASEPEDS
jgi:pimeloyl-ACP methyl ester carboxylesterase